MRESLKNYTPKGDLVGFLLEVINWMLDCQVAQGNKEDVRVFEGNRCAAVLGFDCLVLDLSDNTMKVLVG